jgi:hypothetical protein
MLLGSLLLVGMTVACSSEDDEASPPPTSVDVDIVAEQAVGAMEDLNSFHMEFAFSANNAGIRFLADYADPGDWYERFPASESGEASEIVLVGDWAYVRGCENYPDNCEAWQADERGEGYTVPGGVGFTTTAPEILGLTALEHIVDVQVVDEGDGLVHVAGSAKLARVILENKRRAYGHVKEYQQHCESSGVFDGDTAPAQTCTYLTFEESVEEEYRVQDLDQTPSSPVHLWISPEDFRVHRLILAIPGAPIDAEPAEGERYFEVEYSRFNEVTITPPE